MFAWKDSYSIGVQEIDAQHRRLFSLADELHSAMNAGKGKVVLEQVLQNLITYTKSHFAGEERLMQREMNEAPNHGRRVEMKNPRKRSPTRLNLRSAFAPARSRLPRPPAGPTRCRP